MDRTEFQRGIELFNAREFFEAHEVLEDVWRASTGEEKLFLQGLVQIAVGLHHFRQNNVVGAKSVLARAARNLAPYPDIYSGVHLRPLRLAVEQCVQALEEGRPIPHFPKIEQSALSAFQAENERT